MAGEKTPEANKDELDALRAAQAAEKKTDPIKEKNETSSIEAASKKEEHYKPVETAPIQPEGQQVIPLSVVMEMFKGLTDVLKDVKGGNAEADKKVEDKFKYLVEQLNPEKRGEYRMMSMDEVPVDDYMEEPAVYWTYGHTYSIHSIKIKGQPVTPPYNVPIRFKLSHSDIRGNGRDAKVLYISMFVTNSKKVQEFMEADNNLFNVKYWKDIRQVQNVDHLQATFLVDAAHEINSLDTFAVINKAKAKGVPVVQDVMQMRMALIHLIAKENYDKQKNMSGSSTNTAESLEAVLKQRANQSLAAMSAAPSH